MLRSNGAIIRVNHSSSYKIDEIGIHVMSTKGIGKQIDIFQVEGLQCSPNCGRCK